MLPKTNYYRGHPVIEDENGNEVWVEDKAPYPIGEEDKECPACGLTPYYCEECDELHDGCLGHLPGVVNACCGHGIEDHAYIMFEQGRVIRSTSSFITDERRFAKQEEENAMVFEMIEAIEAAEQMEDEYSDDQS